MDNHTTQQQTNRAPSFIFGNYSERQWDSTTCSLNNIPWQQSHSKQQQSDDQTMKEKQAIDKYLAESIDRLSVEDRKRAIEEVHGIADTTKEIPDLEQCLDSLENHLFLLKRGTAYEKAELQNKDFVLNQSLRIMFLRRNQYIAKAAAEQMIRFFERKQELFGTDKLAQEILLDDLDPISHECVASGCLQFLNKRDRANRPIFLMAPGLRKRCPLIHELRSQFYMMMTFL